MGTLTLVRHGQASFFSENYDQLSPLGEQQARLLGEYWVRQGVHFDEVITGPRVRQIETAALVGEAFAKSGLPWPEPRFMPEFDEHQVDRLIKLAMPRIKASYPDIGVLHERYRAAELPRDKHRTFQRMFEQVVMLWVAGKIEAPEVESWPAFRDRVSTGLKGIFNGEARGRRVAAFTSVGAITVGLQLSLTCDDRAAFDLGWRVRNASVTEFVFSRDRLTMDGFNALAHLQDSQLWTFR
jgi:broad specificity phosphatase PhoE